MVQRTGTYGRMYTSTEVEFYENKHGVHVLLGEFTVCGFAFDAPETESADDVDGLGGHLEPAITHIVTCPKCAAVVRAMRSVRVRNPSASGRQK